MRTNDHDGTRRAGAAAIWALTAVLALAGLAGCEGQVGDEPVGESTAAEMSAAELGRLGGRIHAEPERTAELLADAGLTEEELDARVREVTADPDASREYARAFREVAGEEDAEDAGEDVAAAD